VVEKRDFEDNQDNNEIKKQLKIYIKRDKNEKQINKKRFRIFDF